MRNLEMLVNGFVSQLSVGVKFKMNKTYETNLMLARVEKGIL